LGSFDKVFSSPRVAKAIGEVGLEISEVTANPKSNWQSLKEIWSMLRTKK